MDIRFPSRALLALIPVGLVAACHAPLPRVHAAHTTRMACFPPGLQRGEKLATCEPSGVVISAGVTWVANDKPVPGEGLSPFFAMGADGQPAQYVTEGPLPRARKIEDLAVSPDGETLFATSGFDRIKPAGQSDWDAYNTLMAWQRGSPGEARVLRPSKRDGITSSRGLRHAIRAATPGNPGYLKIEGLAALPGNRLWMGVREAGTAYDAFDYRRTVLDMHTEGAGAETTLVGDPAFHCDITLEDTPDAARWALSGLAYDGSREMIWVLVSVEAKDGTMDGAIFAMRDDGGRCSAKPLRDAAGTPIRFGHKAEGLAVVDACTLRVTHDDDRTYRIGERWRGAHEAWTTEVKLCAD